MCEKNIDSKEELLKHMPSHSYKPSSELNFKCEECDFWGPNQLTMEVHIGKHHSERFECGLCDYKGKDFDDLDIHLVTCELYRCTYCLCNLNFKTISSLKTHVNEKHQTPHMKRNTDIMHAKIDRNNSEIISTRIYKANNFFEYPNWKEIM